MVSVLNKQSTMHRENKINLLICVLTLSIIFGSPMVCYAHGDPMVVYVLFSSSVIHIAISLYLLFASRFKKKRIPVILIYVANVAPTWLWALGYRGSEMVAYIGLLGLPLITCLCLTWLCSDRLSAT